MPKWSRLAMLTLEYIYSETKDIIEKSIDEFISEMKSLQKRFDADI